MPPWRHSIDFTRGTGHCSRHHGKLLVLEWGTRNAAPRSDDQRVALLYMSDRRSAIRGRFTAIGWERLHDRRPYFSIFFVGVETSGSHHSLSRTYEPLPPHCERAIRTAGFVAAIRPTIPVQFPVILISRQPCSWNVARIPSIPSARNPPPTCQHFITRIFRDNQE